MSSEYAMQIVHVTNGKIVEWAPGLAAEVELVNTLCDRVRAKGVGIGTTEAHVIADVRAAFVELLMDLKARI